MAEEKTLVPGWYRDEPGQLWWWDGRTWSPGPAAPASEISGFALDAQPAEDRDHAWIVWLASLAFFGPGWVVSLVFYFLDKDKAFARHHAAQALNLHIITTVVGTIGSAVFAFRWLDGGGSFSVGPLFVVAATILGLNVVYSSVVSVVGLVQARRGIWWRAPLPFRPVKGAVAKGEEPYSVR